MNIIEQHDTLVLRNGEGSPRAYVLGQVLLVVPIAVSVLVAQVSAAMHGWTWAWLATATVPAALIACWRSWSERCHATVEIDRRRGRVRVERRFATRTIEDRLSLGDVTGLEVLPHSREREAFAPVLALRDGRRIRLGPARAERAPIERAVEALRKAL